MVHVNNADEICVKHERSLRTPSDETKMKTDCDQQMAFLSTLKPVATSNNYDDTRDPSKSKTSSILPVKYIPSIDGIQRKNHAGRVRRSIE